MSLTPESLFLIFGFFAIATVYSSVGFGGGSSYLALLALMSPNFLEIKLVALLCNLVVVSGSSVLFFRQGLFQPKPFLSLALFSVPASFLGAMVHLSQPVFFILLGSVLALSGLLLLLQFLAKPVTKNQEIRPVSVGVTGGIGAGAGFLSGLVGIGGGVLIAPLWHLFHWAEARTIAALAAFFILVNSLAGVLGLVASGSFKVEPSFVFPLLLAVFMGSQLGTRLTIKKLSPQIIKGLTGAFVLFIGVKLVLQYS